MLLPTMLRSPLILILLEASRSTWKSVDLVQMHMEAILQEEAEYVVAVEPTRAVREVVREEAAFQRMEVVVVATCLAEAVANLRLHDPLGKHLQPHECSNY